MILSELQVPLSTTISSIIEDLNKLKQALIDAIPHREGKKTIDTVHSFAFKHTDRPSLRKKDIEEALTELESKEFGRCIGLIAHLVYWAVFGHIN